MQPDGCVYGGGVSETEPETNQPTDLTEVETQIPPEAIIRVEIEATPDDVWQALTTDDGLAGWIGDGSTIGDNVGDEIDVHDVVTGQRKRGVLDEVSCGHRLGYTWWPETEPTRATRVAISLEPTPIGTRVTVTESRPLLAPIGSTAGGARAMATCGTDWAWRTALLTIALTRRAREHIFATAGRGSHGR